MLLLINIAYWVFLFPRTWYKSPDKESAPCVSESDAPTDDDVQIASSDDIVLKSGSDEFLTSDMSSLETESESRSSDTDTGRER